MEGEFEDKQIIDWCIYCKEKIIKGQKYVVDEEGKKYHKECDDLISDNADYFAL